ncbi:Succinate--CoA ligase [ADP-forming] subunit beta [subsurface metagenome]
MLQFGVPVPRGKVAFTPAEARAIAEEIGGKVVVKAQVYAGGRGKAGGIKMADTPEEAEKAASQLLGARMMTHQTGTEGVPVSRVLVEEASEAGGMEIEEVAQAAPEKIFKVSIDHAIGF